MKVDIFLNLLIPTKFERQFVLVYSNQDNNSKKVLKILFTKILPLKTIMESMENIFMTNS